MRSVASGLIAIGILFYSTAALAGDAALTCEASKLKLTAKYGSCRLNAESQALKTGDPVNYSKCDLSKFTDAETKAAGACPTNGDESPIQTYMDDCAGRVATSLGGGGGIPDTCPIDLASCNSGLAVCHSDCVASVRPPLRTGETTSYGTGSDGDLQKGAARSFTDNGDGTITDNTTGLMWEKKDNSGGLHDLNNTYTWSTGTNNMDGTITTVFLANMNSAGGFAGHTDWRIPNRFELETLMDLGASIPRTYPAFNAGCTAGCTVATCSCTQSGGYWSSSTYQDLPSSAWFVYFVVGYTDAAGKTDLEYVRAVRAGS
ncbi:MAG TPA: DUF1566 domain-containing protein [Candidatus Binatia bacterium]|jgi:hypothetical protein